MSSRRPTFWCPGVVTAHRLPSWGQAVNRERAGDAGQRQGSRGARPFRGSPGARLFRKAGRMEGLSPVCGSSADRPTRASGVETSSGARLSRSMGAPGALGARHVTLHCAQFFATLREGPVGERQQYFQPCPLDDVPLDLQTEPPDFFDVGGDVGGVGAENHYGLSLPLARNGALSRIAHDSSHFLAIAAVQIRVSSGVIDPCGCTRASR
jgi:hypothetical protein